MGFMGNISNNTLRGFMFKIITYIAALLNIASGYWCAHEGRYDDAVLSGLFAIWGFFILYKED